MIADLQEHGTETLLAGEVFDHATMNVVLVWPPECAEETCKRINWLKFSLQLKPFLFGKLTWSKMIRKETFCTE